MTDNSTWTVRLAEDADWLVKQISDASRKKPWVVMSTASGEIEPRFDLDQVVNELAGLAQIAVVIDGEASWRLSSLLVDYEDVYAGAARVYPAGYTPENPLKPGPVRTLQRGQSEAKPTARLISDALSSAYQSGVFETQAASAINTTGTIRGFLGDHRAIVDVGGSLASLAEETTYPGVPLHWLFREGQEITGRHESRNGRFLADTRKPQSEELVEQFPYGTVTWALVDEADRRSALLRVHPGHQFSVSRAEVSGNELDRVDLLLSPGEVVRTRIYRDPQGKTRLRLDDIDDDEAVLDSIDFGAGPWIVEGRDLAEDDEDSQVSIDTDKIEIASLASVTSGESLATPEVETAQAPAPRPGPGPAVALPQASKVAGQQDKADSSGAGKTAVATLENQLHTLRGRLSVAEARLQRLGGDKAEVLYNQVREERNQAFTEINHLKGELKEARADLSEARKKLRNQVSSGHTSSPSSRKPRFATAEEWFREEVRRTWLSLYTPQERARWAIIDSDWNLGSRFTDSLTELRDSQLRRVTKLVVHLVTGRNAEQNIVESHPLRSADEVSAPPVTREDGAVCLRAYVEEGMPQSRRLHYWKLGDGSLELSRVVLHDDMQP